MTEPDAVVVGSGPNGLAAALTLARAGLTVQVFEGAPEAGGGCRTGWLTLPGFAHDVCAAVHPLAAASPFFRSLDLAALGAVPRTPRIAVAHPLDRGRAGAAGGSVAATASRLGTDASAYRRLMEPLVGDCDAIMRLALAPLRSVPGELIPAVRFGAQGLLPARLLAGRLRTAEGRALLAGVAAHSVRPLSAPLTGAFALILMVLAHTTGWPVIEGGSGRLVAALTAELAAHGGTVTTGTWIERLGQLPRAKAVLADVPPRQFLAMAGDRLPAGYRRAMRRFRHGPGACKVDWALDGPVPWQNASCREAGTVHVGGSIAEVSRSEAEVAAGRHPERPFCLVVQPGVADSSRAPGGRQTLWAYCHVPAGSAVDMTSRIESQIERFAPGFVIAFLPARCARQPTWSATTPAMSAAISPAGQHAAADGRPAGAAMEPVPDAAARGVPVLGVHPAGRWRTRHVRLLGRPHRAA